MRLLILCTGNSCRSQMAEGFLRSFDTNLEVFSAGTAPSQSVNSNAIKVMSEVGIDISDNKPENVDIYIDKPFDYVVTVCGGAKEDCPAFLGEVKHHLHKGYDDPADATGTDEEVLAVFRKTRDLTKKGFYDFYKQI